MNTIKFVNFSGSAKQQVTITNGKSFANEAKSGIKVNHDMEKVTISGVGTTASVGSNCNGYKVVVTGVDNRVTIKDGISVRKLEVEGTKLNVVVEESCVVENVVVEGSDNKIDFSPNSKFGVLKISGPSNVVNTPQKNDAKISVTGVGNKINGTEVKESQPEPNTTITINGVEHKFDKIEDLTISNWPRKVIVNGKKID